MPEPKESRVRPFADVLTELDGGTVNAQLGSGLKELTEAVISTGKAGTLTLQLKLKPAGRGATDALLVIGQVKLTAPDAEPGSSVYFVDGDGCLSRENPIQPQLPLREVPTPPAAADRPVRHIQES